MFVPSALTLIIISAHAEGGGVSASLECCTLPISMHPPPPLGAPSPGAAFFRALPEYAVMVTMSLSAMTPQRDAPPASIRDCKGLACDSTENQGMATCGKRECFESQTRPPQNELYYRVVFHTCLLVGPGDFP